MFKKPATGKKGNLSQFGLIDIPDLDDDEPMDLSDDDFDLDAELAAIGGSKPHRPRKPAPVASGNLDAMIAASLKDVPSDDEDVSGDEDDPDLLNELKELSLEDDEAPPPPPRMRTAPPPPGAAPSAQSSTVSLLQDRISNYTLAEKQAKESGESARARRFGRGIKTLSDLLKQAKAGKPIKDEDIPPPVSVGKPASEQAPTSQPTAPIIEPPSAPTEASVPDENLIDLAPEPSLPEPKHPPPELPKELGDPEKEKGLQMILKRKEEFKAAALTSKHAGDKTMALEYLKVVKQFDIVVDAYKSGQEMDLSELPTPDAIAAAFKSQKVEEQTQKSTEPVVAPVADESGLITASTVEEALKQRLAAFQQQEAKAKEEGNASKARRLGRVVKQYEEAARQHAAGKPVAFAALPTPLGYAPIPAQGAAAGAPAPAPSPGAARPPAPSPSPAPRPASTNYDKQIAFLLQRQKQFKEAALKAKKDGDIEKAKEYLRSAKGFDSMIEAAKGGLKVDLKSIPLPPKAKSELEHTFDVVSADDCGGADSDVGWSRARTQLAAQRARAGAGAARCRAAGRVADAHRLDHLAAAVAADIDALDLAHSLGQKLPKFHFESRTLTIVQCNEDLNENDLELKIVRGIAYNVPNPKEIDTYVKFEFPYPQEAPVSDRTPLVKDTNSPQYDAVFPLTIHRGARPCLRVFKRHGIKFEVYSRGCCGSSCAADSLLCCSGWFSRDTLIGTVTVKLAPLETQITIHESFPLMEGRRAAGGSLEVRLRVRTPLLQPLVEVDTQRWLVLDH